MASAIQVAPAAPWRDEPRRLLDVDEAVARVVGAFAPLGAERAPLAEALGRTLAVDVVAGQPMPAFANAAMDGFALRAADTAEATASMPAELRVVDLAAAGAGAMAAVGPGEAIRIMTGAPVPAGADAVVRFEETDETDAPGRGLPGSAIGVRRPVRSGENVRPVGEDFPAGRTLLAAGDRLRPAEIGLLAALNRTLVEVRRRPRVAVLATGDEIVDAGQPLRPGQIRNSNGPMVAGLVRRCGGDPVVLGVAGDTAAALRERLAEAASADLIVTTGGVSVGDYDMVKRVLRQDGRIDLWQVRIKPGKPLAFGWLGATPLVGLPGNPVAAAVAFEQFVRPAISRMLGRRSLAIPTVPARLTERVENRGGRRHFVRVRAEWDGAGFVAALAGGQGSGALSALARANGLLVIPESAAVAEPSSIWPVQMLDWDVG